MDVRGVGLSQTDKTTRSIAHTVEVAPFYSHSGGLGQTATPYVFFPPSQTFPHYPTIKQFLLGRLVASRLPFAAGRPFFHFSRPQSIKQSLFGVASSLQNYPLGRGNPFSLIMLQSLGLQRIQQGWRSVPDRQNKGRATSNVGAKFLVTVGLGQTDTPWVDPRLCHIILKFKV